MSRQSYSEVIEPIAKPGENIKLDPEISSAPDFVEVKSVLSLPKDTVDIAGGTTVNAGSQSSKYETTEMEMTSSTLAQFYVKPVNDFELRVYQLQGSVLSSTKSEVQGVRRATKDNLTQVFVWEDDTNPYLEVNNLTNYQLPNSYVTWFGFKYLVDEVVAPSRYVTVSVQDTM